MSPGALCGSCIAPPAWAALAGEGTGATRSKCASLPLSERIRTAATTTNATVSTVKNVGKNLNRIRIGLS